MAAMVDLTAVPAPTGRRGWALVGLAGGLLSGIGDVLILGRGCSGRDFDRAAGMVPAHIAADATWQSLWNGAALPVRRVRAGTLSGHVGIGLLQLLALRGLSRGVHAEPERRIAGVSATAFAISGVLTHQCCASVILAYRRAGANNPLSSAGPVPAPRSATPLLAVSAAATLGALAAFSASLTVAGLRQHTPGSAWSWAVTPLPCVLAALLSFGALPAPLGGYVRPASISVGLMAYFAIAAAPRSR